MCGREVRFIDVAYIHRGVIVCRDCMPKYYVRYLCRAISRRISEGEQPACRYCRYYDECTRYIRGLRDKTSDK